jgi:CBS domain-containing protein
VWLLVALFAIRAAATWLAVAGGGVGGLFVPLVVQGAVAGAAVQSIVDVPNATLFPTLGIAALLGAGYRTPLAGVAFVAEATGQPGFVVPALVAAVVAQLAMGRRSFSSYQREERLGHLEQRLAMRVADVLTPDPDGIAPDATVASFMEQAAGGTGRRWLPVVERGRFRGTIALADAISVPQGSWATTQVSDVMRQARAVAPDVPVALAAAAMDRNGEDHVAVVEDGVLVGVLTAKDLTKLDQLLDAVEGDDPPDEEGGAR